MHIYISYIHEGNKIDTYTASIGTHTCIQCTHIHHSHTSFEFMNELRVASADSVRACCRGMFRWMMRYKARDKNSAASTGSSCLCDRYTVLTAALTRDSSFSCSSIRGRKWVALIKQLTLAGHVGKEEDRVWVGEGRVWDSQMSVGIERRKGSAIFCCTCPSPTPLSYIHTHCTYIHIVHTYMHPYTAIKMP
jgi:hypothetical protein